MSKISTILKSKKVKKRFLWSFAVIFGIFLVLFVVLKIGFSVDNIKTHLFAAEQLYIKLDKKLILKAKKIQIFESNSEASKDFDLTQAMQVAQNLKYLYFFFEEVGIEDLSVDEQHLNLSYKEGEFSLKHERFSVILSIAKAEHLINARVKEFMLTDTDANVSVDLSIDTKRNQYNFAGTLESSRTYFDFMIGFTPKQVFFRLDNLSITDIKYIFDQLKRYRVSIGEEATLWLSERVLAEYYHFDYLEGGIRLTRNPTITELGGVGFVKNLIVKPAENIEDIKLPYVDINVSKTHINFEFDEASFNGKDISQSQIYIYDIAYDNRGIFVGVKSDELMLDDKMQALLKHFGINFPLTQKYGKITSDFSIRIPFSHPENNDYRGEFIAEEAGFKQTNLLVHKGKVKLEDKKVFLDDFKISNDFVRSDLNASIDIANKSGIFDANITKLHFDGILDMQDEVTRLDLSFKDDILVNAKDWGLYMNFTEGLNLRVSQPMIFEPFSPLLQNFRVSKIGDFTLDTKDFENFNIQVSDTHFDMGLFKSNMQEYNSDDFFIEKKGANLRIRTTSDLVGASVQDDYIKAHAQNLYYLFEDSGETSALPQNLNLELSATNFGVLLEDFEKTLFFDSLNLSLYDGAINAFASRDKARIELRKNQRELFLRAAGMDDKFINTFFRKKVVQNGQFGILIQGDNEKSFEGKIVFSDTFYNGFKAYNQLISFIDTIPSLALFKSPTFNEKGLKVKKGVILFSRYNDDIGVNALTFKGDSIDILGVGDINLSHDIVEMELEIRTLKSTSELIAKVPILNQIILGKDRVIATRILVDGTIDEPKFHTQIVKDALKIPFNILKNIVELPTTLGK